MKKKRKEKQKTSIYIKKTTRNQRKQGLSPGISQLLSLRGGEVRAESIQARQVVAEVPHQHLKKISKGFERSEKQHGFRRIRAPTAVERRPRSGFRVVGEWQHKDPVVVAVHGPQPVLLVDADSVEAA